MDKEHPNANKDAHTPSDVEPRIPPLQPFTIGIITPRHPMMIPIIVLGVFPVPPLPALKLVLVLPPPFPPIDFGRVIVLFLGGQVNISLAGMEEPGLASYSHRKTGARFEIRVDQEAVEVVGFGQVIRGLGAREEVVVFRRPFGRVDGEPVDPSGRERWDRIYRGGSLRALGNGRKGGRRRREKRVTEARGT